MNGINGHAGVPPLWQEARNADGRVYYYNTITKATQWDKPEELMSAVERALSKQPWKEYTAEGGRKYWYNTETKQSSWEMPQVYKEALAKETPASPPVAAPTFVAGGGFPVAQLEQRDREPIVESRPAYEPISSRAQPFVPSGTSSEFSSFDEAEAAFMKLLRRSGVQPDWTWEQTMKAIIKDPQWRALKDPKDRRAAFDKYVVEVRIQEKDRAKERLAKLRTDFATMLKSHPEIKHYTRWKTAKPIIEGETIYRSARDDDERRQLFEDYIIELKKANMEKEALVRKAAMDELVEIVNSLNLEPYTRWSEAHERIQANPRFQEDEKFKTLSKSDVLTVFENHIKYLERTFNDVRQQQKNQKARRERQNRDRFIALLQELRADGKIKAGTKWSQIYPLIENDDRYTAMLGQSGSTPLDLFWDVVEEEERALRGTRNDILDVLDDNRFEVQPKTTFEEFQSLLQSDRRTANIDRDILQLMFERVRDKASRRHEDDRHQNERHQRRAIEGLRSYMRHLEPPIRSDDTYDKVRPLLEKSDDYQALSDDLRRSAFDKVIRRLKEKEEDDRERSKRRDRSSVERSHRDRADRAHRSRHVRPSRTPEPDVYEADRRKAIADREKNYRKSSAADTLLSPGRRSSDVRPDRERERERERDRDRDRERERERDRERDRDYDRPRRGGRDRSPDRYDRDRRERDDERERGYRRRADPRGSIDELPYGDERPRRRRADSDGEDANSKRDSKRPRRDRSRERSPAPQRDRRPRTKTPPASTAPPAKEDAAIHSGSEEGEIEED